MIESIDVLKPGMFLVCVHGPLVTLTESNGRRYSKIDRSLEGTMVKVVALSPPIAIFSFYPIPCGDQTHSHQPYPLIMKWDRMGWACASEAFVAEYLRLGENRPEKQEKLNTYSLDQFRADYRGAQAHPPAGPQPNDDDERDDLYGAMFSDDDDEDDDEGDADGSPTS